MTAVHENAINFQGSATLTEEELQTQTQYVRVYANYPEDVTTDDVMHAIEASGTLDFWNDPEEDIYSERDGDGV